MIFSNATLFMVFRSVQGFPATMNNAFLVRARLFSRNKTLYGCEFGVRKHKASYGSQFGAGIPQQATNTLFVFFVEPELFSLNQTP